MSCLGLLIIRACFFQDSSIYNDLASIRTPSPNWFNKLYNPRPTPAQLDGLPDDPMQNPDEEVN
jgi:hypothetical protein